MHKPLMKPRRARSRAIALTVAAVTLGAVLTAAATGDEPDATVAAAGQSVRPVGVETDALLTADDARVDEAIEARAAFDARQSVEAAARQAAAEQAAAEQAAAEEAAAEEAAAQAAAEEAAAEEAAAQAAAEQAAAEEAAAEEAAAQAAAEEAAAEEAAAQAAAEEAAQEEAAQDVSTGSNWDRLADCESGDWDGNGYPISGSARWDYGVNFSHGDSYEGGLNFHPGTWDSYRSGGHARPRRSGKSLAADRRGRTGPRPAGLGRLAGVLEQDWSPLTHGLGAPHAALVRHSDRQFRVSPGCRSLLLRSGAVPRR